MSWKLCWGPLTGRYLPDILKGAHFLGGDQQPVLTEVRRKKRLSNVCERMSLCNYCRRTQITSTIMSSITTLCEVDQRIMKQRRFVEMYQHHSFLFDVFSSIRKAMFKFLSLEVIREHFLSGDGEWSGNV